MNGTALAGARRTVALAVVAIAMVMDILDLTIVNVAIPSLQAHFHASDSQLQWMVAGYATAFAVLLITGGRSGDIFGYRRMLMLGMAVFAAASLACGIAASPAQLVAARLCQGGAAAFMLPQVMSLVQVLYAPHERISALSVFGVLGGAAAAAGPVLGGLIIGADLFGLGWRPIFLINVPVALLDLLAAALLVPAARSKHAPRMDLTGTLLVTLCLLALMFPLIQARQVGWPAWHVVLLALSLPLAVAVILHSRSRMAHDGSALIVPALFQERAFSIGLIITLCFQIAMGGLLFTMTLMLQGGLAFSPAQAGIAHIPFAVGAAISIGGLSRQLLPRFGPVVLAWGAATMLAGLVLLVGFTGFAAVMSLNPLTLCPAILVMGLGMGLLAGPLTPVALSEVDTAYAGAASGTLKAVQELGSAVGVVLVGAVFFASVDSPSASGTLHGFRAAAASIGLSLVAVIVLVRFLPKNLRILAQAPG